MRHRWYDRIAGAARGDGQPCLPRAECPESLGMPEPRHGATCRQRRKHTCCHRCTGKAALRKVRLIAVAKFAMKFQAAGECKFDTAGIRAWERAPLLETWIRLARVADQISHRLVVLLNDCGGHFRAT